jgi:hypothetical protein
VTSTIPEPDERPSRSRRLLVLLVAAVDVAVALVVAIRDHGPDDAVVQALDIARPESGYDSGLEAGRTLARAASALNRGIRECDRTTEPDRCAALGAVSGYIQVVAATVVRCTAPGRSEARGVAVELLEDLRTRRPGDPPPPTPPIPSCRG